MLPKPTTGLPASCQPYSQLRPVLSNDGHNAYDYYSVHFQLLQLCCTIYQNENLKIALIDTLVTVIIEVIDYHLLLYKYFTAAQKTHHNGIDNIAVVVFQSFDSL